MLLVSLDWATLVGVTDLETRHSVTVVGSVHPPPCPVRAPAPSLHIQGPTAPAGGASPHPHWSLSPHLPLEPTLACESRAKTEA